MSIKTKDLFTGEQVIYGDDATSYLVQQVISQYGDTIEPHMITRHAAMLHPAILNLISQIPGINCEEQAADAVWQAFCRMPSFETLARTTRKEKNDPSGMFKSDLAFAGSGWYQSYLDTSWWKRKRQEAFDFFGMACFFCNCSDNLEVHHRHYNSIGNEIPKNDLSIFCREHHECLHSKSKQFAPYKAPQAALDKIALG